MRIYVIFFALSMLGGLQTFASDRASSRFYCGEVLDSDSEEDTTPEQSEEDEVSGVLRGPLPVPNLDFGNVLAKRPLGAQSEKSHPKIRAIEGPNSLPCPVLPSGIGPARVVPKALNFRNVYSRNDLEFLNDSYEISEILGEGAQGTVYRALKRGENREVALKVSNYRSAKKPQLKEADIATVQSFANDWIIKYNSYKKHQINDRRGVKYFIAIETPLYKQNLSQYIKTLSLLEQEISENEVWELTARMASALNTVALAGYVHLDVKPENIFLNNDVSSAVLGDFGLLTKAGLENDLDDEGDSQFAALEFVDQNILIGPERDIASLGFSLLQICSSVPLPKNGGDFGWRELRTDRNFAKSLMRPTYSQELVDLILAMIDQDPAKRPTAQDILDKTLAREAK